MLYMEIMASYCDNHTNTRNVGAKYHDMSEICHVMTASQSVGHPLFRAFPGTSDDFKIDR
jgi:hypothetical protein